MMRREMTKRDITRDQFHALIKKAAQPVVSIESDLEPLETSVEDQDDGCSEIDTHSDMIEDISD